jgi:glycosyltransferase involved in cell wall biosynthesis
LRRYIGLEAAPLYPPVPREGLQPEDYAPYILSVSRLDDAKRVESAIRAMPSVDRSLRLEIVGDGPSRGQLEQLARTLGVEDRVVFRGRASDDEVRELYNGCRAVYYAPIDEDYGYAAIEALTAAKPVVTAPDSGGILEFVTDEVTGLVAPLNPESLAGAFNRLSDRSLARRLGENGPERTAGLTWDLVVESLLAG